MFILTAFCFLWVLFRGIVMVSYLLQASIATSTSVVCYFLLKHLLGEEHLDTCDDVAAEAKKVFVRRYIRVRSEDVGLIIGKKGSNIYRMEQESGCFLRVVYYDPRSAECFEAERFRLGGSYEDGDAVSEDEECWLDEPAEKRKRVPYLEVIAKAEEKLDYLVKLLDDTIRRSKEKRVEEIMHVPREFLGYIIGQRGCTIRRISKATNTSVTVENDDKDENGNYLGGNTPSSKAKVRIYGPESQVRVAADMVEQTIWSCMNAKRRQLGTQQRDDDELEQPIEEQLEQRRVIQQACEVDEDERW